MNCMNALNSSHLLPPSLHTPGPMCAAHTPQQAVRLALAIQPMGLLASPPPRVAGRPRCPHCVTPRRNVRPRPPPPSHRMARTTLHGHPWDADAITELYAAAHENAACWNGLPRRPDRHRQTDRQTDQSPTRGACSQGCGWASTTGWATSGLTPSPRATAGGLRTCVTGAEPGNQSLANNWMHIRLEKVHRCCMTIWMCAINSSRNFCRFCVAFLSV